MTTTAQRTYTNVGSGYFPDAQAEIDAAIETIEWRTDLDGGTWPMAPGLGIQEVIKELRLPKVSAVGISEKLLEGHYAVYGIEAHYKNGRALVYVTDQGHILTPIASDFFPAA